MSEVVLNSSALLAHLHKEPGGEAVAPLLPVSAMSVVNIAEVISKLIDNGDEPDEAALTMEALPISAHEADLDLALEAAALRASTRIRGLSLGDRFCLALAARLGLPVLTTDRAWTDLDIGVDIRLIR